MPSSIASEPGKPVWFALGLILGLVVTLTAFWLWGTALIETVLPLTRSVLGWVDDRFGILFLGVEHNWQDTVVRLRVGVTKTFVMGGQVIEASPQGWLEVTTTTGAMLQPLVIAPTLALALPGTLITRMIATGLAALLAFLFLLLDLPLTLHAYVWDMFVDKLEPDRISPLMIWHEFLHAGGRLGAGLMLGLFGWRLAARCHVKTIN